MSDGAALELPRRAWVPLPAAPHPIPPYAAKAVLGYSLYVIAGAQMLEYDAGLDAWRTHPAPAEHSRLVAVERSVVAIGPSDEAGAAVDEMYDPATRSWHRLPDDPLGPSFGRTAVGTPSGLVLFAHDLVPDPGVTPSFVRAAVLDLGSRRWRKLPTSDQLGGGAWTWTGKRLVDATVGGADGGEVNGYGRMIPYGGTLDPRTGAWGRLPDAPDEPARNGWAATAIDGPAIAAGGWLYDDFAETWRVLPRPDGAPAQAGDAAWAGGSLVVLGGLTYTDSPLTRDPRAWIFPMPD
jgi:hypothetical protein